MREGVKRQYIAEFTVQQVESLVDMFCADPHTPFDESITVITGSEESEVGHIPALYAYYTNYPHEGTRKL